MQNVRSKSKRILMTNNRSHHIYKSHRDIEFPDFTNGLHEVRFEVSEETLAEEGEEREICVERVVGIEEVHISFVVHLYFNVQDCMEYTLQCETNECWKLMKKWRKGESIP